MRHAILCLLMLPLGLAGCEEDHIRIVVTPKADGTIHREVRIWKTSAVEEGETPKILAPTKTLLHAPRKVYGESIPGSEPVVVFRADLPGVPADLADEGLTNHGGYTIWTSRLGSSHLYRERFPGRTDVYDTVRTIGELTDLAADVLAVMAEQELAGEKGVEKLAVSIRGPFKKDVQNLITMLVAAHAATDDSLVPEGEKREEDLGAAVKLSVRALQYLEERDYIRI